MNSNYKVQEFSLKRIMENLDKIPRNGVFEDDRPKLTGEQKQKLMDMVSRFNEYGRVLQVEQAIAETSKTLSEIAEMAEVYACNEASDWFQQDTIKKDFKDLKGRVMEFQKIAKDTYGGIQRLNALYEDMGHVLSRYYEIKDIQEILRKGPAVDQDPVARERQDMQDSEPQLMESDDVEEVVLRKGPRFDQDPVDRERQQMTGDCVNGTCLPLNSPGAKSVKEIATSPQDIHVDRISMKNDLGIKR
jgi:hypothetical protein